MLPSYFTGGREILEKISRDAAQTACLAGRTICRVLGKYIVYVDAEDVGIAPHLCLDGFWESWITVAMARELKSGFCCLDIGANHGYYSLVMADAAGPGGRVLAVEPNPAMADLLALTMEVNGFAQQVSIAPVAVADRVEQRASFTVPRRRGLLAHLTDLAVPEENSVELEMTTVDRLTAAWPRVDAIKIDAEGSEDRIWAGMQATLQRNPQIVVMLEFTPSRYHDPEEFAVAIRAAGFTLRFVEEDGRLSPITVHELTGGGNDERAWWMLNLRRG